MTKSTLYRDWQPIIEPEAIYASKRNFGRSHVFVVGTTIYWTENRPAEQGRTVLVAKDASGTLTDITPADYYIRSRVHEYGGRAVTIHKNKVYFVNFTDQRIYRQDLDSLADKPRPLTPASNEDGSLGKYAALQVSPDGKLLVCIYEKDDPKKENQNFLAVLDLTHTDMQEPKILAQNYDFYAEPQLSSDGNQIAWLSWNHPNMPWDATELYVAELDRENNSLISSRKVAGGEGISICYPKFNAEGILYFIMDYAGYTDQDAKNWWNFYRCKQGKEVEQVTHELVDFGDPMWGLGNNKYAFFPNGDVITRYFTATTGTERLVVIKHNSHDIQELQVDPYSIFGNMEILNEKEALVVAAGSIKPNQIVKINVDLQKIESVAAANDTDENTYSFALEDISSPELIKYPTEDGDFAYAYLYLPKNSNYEKNIEDKPPVYVQVHGGPTSRASPNFRLEYQFWTSQGFAILDVDHRGSTGYGREYRDKMRNNWGVMDAYDIKNGIEYLQKNGTVSDKVVISGGSAGGYAVQRGMTLFPDLYKAGASFFGIGNLFTLFKGASEMHKFESQYDYGLFGGPSPNYDEILTERSPITHMTNLKSPMILLQGAEDKVVPPENSREIVKILMEKGIYNEYVEYEGEGHGFRQKENLIDSLTKEAAFFSESALFLDEL